MYYRKKFVTNSSSTCFIAYGVQVAATDKSKFEELLEMEQVGGVSIVSSYLDKECATLYWTESELPASEYNFWQSVEHPHLDHLVKREADATFEQLAKEYGCEITDGPFWGLYNSGH
jgi:hypothetical protein